MFSKKKSRRVPIQDIPVDPDAPVFAPNQKEVDDVSADQFGRPFSNLYRVYDPPFKKVHAKGLKAFHSLCKIFGATND